MTLLSAGCHAIDFYESGLEAAVAPQMEPPSELAMVSLPEYRIEPPDMVRIETLKLIPRPPYRIEAHDALMIRAFGTPYNMPLDNYYTVSEMGIVDLGPAYGEHYVMGQTVEEAAETIRRNLQYVLQQPQVTVQLARSASAAEISGDYLVGQDGMVNLRGFGMVYLAGKTVTEARRALLEQLNKYFESLDLSVDVVGYYSDVYYVIVAGADASERIESFPITGNETVLDAIAQIRNLSQVSSKTMWVARPAPGRFDAEQTLPVDWDAIARGGATETNYQLLPDDRLYIVDDQLVAANQYIDKFTTPISRLLSITGLGSRTIRGIQVLGRTYNRDRRY
ncbi:MAG: polysaccharide biosynthesis/export family protein [Pirellulales bacterium]|nr:polysaccharide biosynthesis/export family protein [Pirellulales bacterium]